jgi:hypothetical protein
MVWGPKERESCCYFYCLNYKMDDFVIADNSPNEIRAIRSFLLFRLVVALPPLSFRLSVLQEKEIKDPADRRDNDP